MFYCVHYYKDAMLGRFYAICSCCSCCCGAMQAHQNGTPMLASSGYVARVDADLCAGCGSCADVCQFAAISVDDGFACINISACMGCGVCVAHCTQETIDLIREPTKGIPLEIRELVSGAAKKVPPVPCTWPNCALVGKWPPEFRYRLNGRLKLLEAGFFDGLPPQLAKRGFRVHNTITVGPAPDSQIAH